MSAIQSVEILDDGTKIDEEVMESYTKIWNSVLPGKVLSRSPNLISSSPPCNITH